MSEPRQLPANAVPPKEALSVSTVLIGIFAGRDSEGRPCVTLPNSDQAGVHVASASCSLAELSSGMPVAVIFIGGDPAQPLILGPVAFPPAGCLPWEAPLQSDTPVEENAFVAGEELSLSAGKKISLVCGKASITLTEAGKVIIRGTHLLSRAKGANRIQGGSVELN